MLELKQLIHSAIDNNCFSGCATAVLSPYKTLFKLYAGNRSGQHAAPVVDKDTFFDLASLTKVLSTSLIIMSLYEAGKLDIYEQFTTESGLKTNLAALLKHNSGLPAYKPYYLFYKGRKEILNKAWNEAAIYQPGSKEVYSDIGFMLIEKRLLDLFGIHIEDLYDSEVKNKFKGVEIPIYPDNNDIFEKYAATERCIWRKKIICGEVHDYNTWAMGGKAAHAGLFSTLTGIINISRELLSNLSNTQTKNKWKSESLDMFMSGKNGTHGLGWDSPSVSGYSCAGKLLSGNSAGHTGYTGTSLWFDPNRQIAVILLCNSVYPDGNNSKIRDFRPLFHDTVATKYDNGEFV